MQKAIGEDRLDDVTLALRQTQRGHELRLHVGRETRIGRRADRDRPQRPVGPHGQTLAIGQRLDATAHLDELLDLSVHMVGSAAHQHCRRA